MNFNFNFFIGLEFLTLRTQVVTRIGTIVAAEGVLQRPHHAKPFMIFCFYFRILH